MTDQTIAANGRIYEDARNMVRDAHDRASEPQRTVAMSTIRSLSDDPSNVAALLPMLLEMYLRPDPADIVKAAVDTHAKNCSVKKVLGRMSIAILGAGGGGGLLGAFIQRVVAGMQ